MTAPSQAAQALRAVADQIETASDPHELLRLAALAVWRLNEVVNTQEQTAPAKSDDRQT